MKSSEIKADKGAISTEIRALARIGLVHRSTKLGDRKDYYEAEADFYAAIRSILKERQNSEFDRAIRSVKETLAALDENWVEDEEWQFVYERVQALQDFFDAIDSLGKAYQLENWACERPKDIKVVSEIKELGPGCSKGCIKLQLQVHLVIQASTSPGAYWRAMKRSSH
jgi:DNA-binding transcriptional regulator GbsR (MarR family)